MEILFRFPGSRTKTNDNVDRQFRTRNKFPFFILVGIFSMRQDWISAVKILFLTDNRMSNPQVVQRALILLENAIAFLLY